MTNVMIKEAKMLDISIKSVAKFATNDTKKELFIDTDLDVFQKTDGVKITVIRTDSKYNKSEEGFYDNWIVAYKGNVLYLDEFEYASDINIKKTVGASQFSVILKHLRDLHTNGEIKNIKKNTEFLVEFMMNKPTLSSNYHRKHGMVLIGYSKTKYKVKNGKVISKPEEFEVKGRERIAKMFKFDIPVHVFSGKLGDLKSFESNIIDVRFKPIFNTYKEKLEESLDQPELYIEILRDMFLELESIFGGKEEGVVLTAKDDSFNLKFQQEYQTDQKAREIIKMKHRLAAEENDTYWEQIREKTLEIIDEIGVKDGDTTPIRKIMSQVSSLITIIANDINISNSKKSESTIIDDLQLSVKMKALRMLDGNNGALILGKFRVLTNAHTKIINDALKKYDTVNVVMVSNKETKKNLPLTKKMIALTFGDKINVAFAQTGNLITLLNKFDDNINVVIAGSDRVQAYKKQLLKSPDINVKEIKREDIDISASKVIASFADGDMYFKANTPKEIHNMFDELKVAFS